MQTASQRVAEFVAKFDLDQAPAEVIEKAKTTLLHDVGVALAGHALASTANATAKDFGACSDGTGARLLVDGGRVSVEHAALATGALMHARTQDDTQLAALMHLGCTTLPSLLALGDRDDASGRDFLTAMVAGYEAASAIASGFAARSTAAGFRATSIYGAFASAAATARLLRLSADQTASALGLAASFGGGTNQPWVAGTQEWQYQVGVASRNGMLAAVLASRGVTGAADSLEGAAGHYRSFAGGVEGVDEVGSTLGSQWRILDVTYKPFPICAINQVPVTVLNELVQEHDVREQDVESVVLTLAPHEANYPGTRSQGPFGDVGASLMSAPFCMAVALRERTVRVADLRRFDDQTLMQLVRKITVQEDDSLAGGSCRLSVRTSAGLLRRDHVSTRETFNWGREETASRLHGLLADLPFGAERLDAFTEVALDLEGRSVRDLVTATLA